MPIAFSETQLNLMKAIKHVFDPKGIMNPGKIFE
jgi:glycolate oxidase